VRTTEVAPEAVVSAWIDAFNARDVDGMVACLAADAEFHPLRLHRLERRYRGHEGFRRWFSQLERLGVEERLVAARFDATDPGCVRAIGSLQSVDEPNAAPFYGVHQLSDGLIATAHHYLSDPAVLAEVGLLP
jgi:ketosteroid isomerase-like protein